MTSLPSFYQNLVFEQKLTEALIQRYKNKRSYFTKADYDFKKLKLKELNAKIEKYKLQNAELFI